LAGVVAVIEVLLAKDTPVAATPPKVTDGTASKFVPVMVTLVPPSVGPELGVTLATVGAGSSYVKPLVSVPLWPPGFVTTTLTAPAAWAGVVAVIEVLLEKDTPVAATPPTVTVGTASKLVPLIVMLVPPSVGPELGETLETVGVTTGGGSVPSSPPLAQPIIAVKPDTSSTRSVPCKREIVMEYSSREVDFSINEWRGDG
jgi:formyltetrahydrofolate synthetase